MYFRPLLIRASLKNEVGSEEKKFPPSPLGATVDWHFENLNLAKRDLFIRLIDTDI